MLRIRMQRQGRRNRAHFRIVLTDARVKRQGEYLERLGHYDPIAQKIEQKLVVDMDRVKHWVERGAQPSDKVVGLLKLQGLNLSAALEERTAAQRKARKAKGASKPKAAAPAAKATKKKSAAKA
ncbi:MAG: 30S ribosomal protein S16 [Planctomycetes bacterium]|nr:30S ribosomal protein S16 [Planctomycetota bacterium]